MSYDEYEHAFDEPVRPRETEGAAPGWGDRVAALILLGVEGVVAYGAYLLVLLGGMFFDRCADPALSCDYAFGDVIMLAARIAVIVVVGASVVAVVVRMTRGRAAWWVPLAGSGALVVLAYGAGGLMSLAAS